MMGMAVTAAPVVVLFSLISSLVFFSAARRSLRASKCPS